MCQMASGFINPATFEVKVHDLASHADTATALGLATDGPEPNRWREMHYTPDGEIVCRVLEMDKHTAAECVESVRARWPRFVDFLNWALARTSPTTLDLDSMVDASDVALPAGLTWLSADSATALPPLPAGLTWLSADSATALPPLPAGLTTLYANSATALPPLPAGLTKLSADSAKALPPLPAGLTTLYANSATALPPLPAGLTWLSADSATATESNMRALDGAPESLRIWHRGQFRPKAETLAYWAKVQRETTGDRP
ncbi:MAG: hypothetical protein PHU85_03110 [Phycisphaerae bacterium]|nr:hypothetical protein [Phycisphaerae bacterium]